MATGPPTVADSLPPPPRYFRSRQKMIGRTPLFLAAFSWTVGAFAQPPAAINQKDAQGRKQGPWERAWADSQQLRYKGQFKDDKPVGTFTYYSTLGKVESTVAHYATGGAAHAKHFHPDGKLMAEGRYAGEQKDSTWNYYDATGSLRSTERWKNGRFHGDQEAFFANGQVAERCAWKDGKRNGPCQQFFDSGQVRTSTTYANDVAEGPSLVFTEDGKKEIEGQHVKGQRDGLWKHYNTDGSVLMQILYAQDKVVKEKKENGTFRTFYPDEQVMLEETYKLGKREGKFTEYHANGRWTERPAKVGPDGAEKSETERVLEGQTKKREGTYKNDLLEGEVKEWDEKNKLVKTTVYKNGVEVK
jgi:antitoxin component YwqK of YwqJK toxin-antitoxin module